MNTVFLSASALHSRISTARSSAVREPAFRRLRLRSHFDERKAKINKLKDAVIAHTQDFTTPAMPTSKKPPAEVDITEILSVVIEAKETVRTCASG